MTRRRGVLAGFVVALALVVYSCGELTGAWFSVSPAEAQAELSAALGVAVPPVARVENANDLGWAPTDGPHYGYTAVFAPADFDRLVRALPERTSLEWATDVDSVGLTHEFELIPAQRSLRYFHADE